MRVIAMCLIVSTLLCVPAFAEKLSGDFNDISGKLTATAWIQSVCMYAQCISANIVKTVVHVYVTVHTLLGSNVATGTVEGKAIYGAWVETYDAIVTCNATINGVTKVGYTMSAKFT